MTDKPPMFRSKPHGEHAVYLVEDNEKPEQRIYEIHDSRGNATPLLGSELDSVLGWWADERRRKGGK
jgi:hypothetical protein